MTLTECLLIGIALCLVGLTIAVVRALRWLRQSADELRVLVRLAGSSARITSAKPAALPDAVHLVLMDRGERRVDFVLQVDPAQRAHSVTYEGQMYVCASGSVEDGYFVYRKQ